MTATESARTEPSPQAPPEAPAEAPDPPTSRRFVPRYWHLVLVFSGLALATALTSAPGVWIADARLEFSTDPSGFLAGHAHLWDGTRGMGNPATWYSPTLAAFQAVLQQIGAEPWLIERFVHAALLAVAASGVAAMLRVTAPDVGAFHLLAGLIYAFNPYTSQYLVPSGLFLSYALAPWLLGFFLKGIREREDDWRMAAGFALCIFAHGALNSAALLYALAPLPIAAAYVVFAERSIQARLVLAWLFRAGTLSLLVASGALLVLWFQRGDVALNLTATERQSVVSARSSWAETWRGLGLWLTYFRDSSGELRPQSAAYFHNPLVVVATYGAPVAAGVTLALSRWRPRWFFGALVAFGTVVMVGVWPPSAPSPFGRALNWAFENVLLLRGLRTTYKSGSVVVLGVAILAAYGIVRMIRSARSGRWTTRWGPPVAGWGFAGLLGIAAFPFWSGNLYNARNGFDEIPAYWTEALDWINSRPEDGRVLVLPGIVRTGYRWGYVNDNLFHGLLDKSLVMHQSVPPPGAPLAADVVLALDAHLSAPDYRPGTVGPILRRLGVRWVVFQNDVDWQRSMLPRPSHFDPLRADPDLVAAAAFGDIGENTAALSDIAAGLLGESALRPVEVFEVRDVDDTIRISTERPVIVAGAGDSWAQLARQGRLDAGPVIYTGATAPDDLAAALADGAPLVITDGARRRALQVAGGLVSFSHTLARAESTEREPRSPFEDEAATSYAVYVDAVGIEASASGGGGPLFDPAQRPALAFDEVEHTAWTVSGSAAEGAVLSARLRAPTMVDSVVAQMVGSPARAVGRLTLELVTTNGGVATATEPATAGVPVTFDLRVDDVSEVRLRLEDVVGNSAAPVGVADVTIGAGDRRLDLREFVQTPRDVKLAAGADPALQALLADADVSYSFARRTGIAADEETEIRRWFWAPSDALVDVAGSLQITAATPDVTVDRLVAAEVGAYGSSRAPGLPDGWGVNAVDGDPATAWLGPAATGETLTVRPPPREIGSVEFVITTAEDITGDLREFSEIETAALTATGGGRPIVTDVEAGDRECDLRSDGLRACTRSLSASLPVGRYNTIELQVSSIEPAESPFGTRPLAVSEVLFDGASADPSERAVDRAACRPAFAIDGRPGLVRTLAAGRDDLLGGQVVAFESCEPIRLDTGDHRFVSGASWSGAVSELVISAAGRGDTAAPAPAPGPTRVDVIERSPTRIVLEVTAPAGSLLIGPGAFHEGWRATVDGAQLGKAVPRDALSAWELPEVDAARVELTFRPQRAYELALALSASGVAICLMLLLRRRKV